MGGGRPKGSFFISLMTTKTTKNSNNNNISLMIG